MRIRNVTAALAAAIGICVIGQTAFAQATTVPVANQPKHCQDLAKKGFTIRSETITRSGTASAQVATQPRAGSYIGARKYGQAGANVWFMDSFPGKPREGCRVCGVHVTMKGDMGGANDSFGVIGSNSAQPQFQGTPLAVNQSHLRLASSTSGMPLGPYSIDFMIEGPAFMNWYLNSLAPSLDIFAQDDSSVVQATVTYFWY